MTYGNASGVMSSSTLMKDISLVFTSVWMDRQTRKYSSRGMSHLKIPGPRNFLFALRAVRQRHGANVGWNRTPVSGPLRVARGSHLSARKGVSRFEAFSGNSEGTAKFRALDASKIEQVILRERMVPVFHRDGQGCKSDIMSEDFTRAKIHEEFGNELLHLCVSDLAIAKSRL